MNSTPLTGVEIDFGVGLGPAAATDDLIVKGIWPEDSAGKR